MAVAATKQVGLYTVRARATTGAHLGIIQQGPGQGICQSILEPPKGQLERRSEAARVNTTPGDPICLGLYMETNY